MPFAKSAFGSGRSLRTANTLERRRYVCPICERAQIIDVKLIEKWVLICVHPDSRGGTLPIMQLREEGTILQ